MAFGKGTASTEGFERKLYEGIASCRILAVNPTAAEIEKYRGFKPETEPVYVSEVEVNGKTVKQCRVEFLLQVNPDKYFDNAGNKINLITPMSIFLRNARRTSQKGTIQVMDNWARTAWVTEEQLKNHEIPSFENGGKARIDSNYRIVRDGEADICNLLNKYLSIGLSMEKWVKDPNGNNIYEGLVPNAKEFECYLDDIEKIVNGNVQEIRDAIALQPKNEFKALFYVRSSADGKLYQQVYTNEFLLNSAKEGKINSFGAKILDAQAKGSFPNITFYFGDLHEFSVKPTEFTPKENTSVENIWS